jgi:tRNA-Thr(GGU) m(6)t(6)A37 methyltransferase TsaA
LESKDVAKPDSMIRTCRLLVTSLFSLSFLSSSLSGFCPNVNNSNIRSAKSQEVSSTSDDRIEFDKSQRSNKNNKNEAKTQEFDEKKTPEAPASAEQTSAQKGEVNVPLESITMQPVGHIASVYRLCVGTPRQGLLAPNSRGRIDLYPNRISPDAVLDLDKFSHVWVVFVFHLNSNQKSVERATQKIVGDKVIKRQFKAKIKPPALGGKSVGIFATRTPHRPNPIGFSLCKIDKIVIPPNKKHKHQRVKNQPYHVYVSGLDLVDGTPVLDIKPYVPHYDSIGFMQQEEVGAVYDEVQLPQWVSDGLDKRRPVDFTPEADEELRTIMTSKEGQEMEFYGTSTGRDDTDEEAIESIKSCISEVLSVDVRSKFQTSKARKGKSQAERALRVKDLKKQNAKVSMSDTSPRTSDDVSEKKMSNASSRSFSNNNGICTQQLDRLLIKYTVREENVGDDSCAVDTFGSGADDGIIVVGVEFISK